MLGGLLYGVLTVSFFEANQWSAVGVMRETPDYVHLFLGQLVFGALLTVVIGTWAGQAGAGAGLRLGAVLGALIGFAVDLTMFGVTNVSNITATTGRSVPHDGSAGCRRRGGRRGIGKVR